jgi:hypothetical protein
MPSNPDAPLLPGILCADDVAVAIRDFNQHRVFFRIIALLQKLLLPLVEWFIENFIVLSESIHKYPRTVDGFLISCLCRNRKVPARRA